MAPISPPADLFPGAAPGGGGGALSLSKFGSGGGGGGGGPPPPVVEGVWEAPLTVELASESASR